MEERGDERVVEHVEAVQMDGVCYEVSQVADTVASRKTRRTFGPAVRRYEVVYTARPSVRSVKPGPRGLSRVTQSPGQTFAEHARVPDRTYRLVVLMNGEPYCTTSLRGAYYMVEVKVE